MAIAVQYNKIDDTDYATNLYTAINNLLGPTTNGYGQTLTLSSVSAGDKITALQFTQAYTDILKIARHQGNHTQVEITGLPTITQGTKITAVDVKKYQDAVTYLADVSRRYTVAAPEFSIEAISTSTRTTTWGSSGNTQVGHEFTITFTTAADLRYYFNAGGKIRFSASRSGTSGGETAQNTSWTNLLSSIGTVSFDYTTAIGSAGSNLGIGGLDLTTTYQNIFTISPASTYTANDYTIRAKTNAGYTAIDFQILFNDDSKNAGSFDSVGGTLTSTVDSIRPTGSYVQVLAPSTTIPITRELSVNGIIRT